MDKEIKNFITSIGAKQLPEDSFLKSKFKKPNYFLLNNNFLIVKVSRKKLFCGVMKKFIDFLNNDEITYFLVLLTSSRDGYVFSKQEINNNIKKGYWKLSTQVQYLIYPSSLEHRNRNVFSSPEDFFEKINDYLSVNPK